MPTIVFGLLLGDLFLGLPFRLDDDYRRLYEGGFLDLFHPFACAAGLLAVAPCAMHGGAYVQSCADAAFARRIGRYTSGPRWSWPFWRWCVPSGWPPRSTTIDCWSHRRRTGSARRRICRSSTASELGWSSLQACPWVVIVFVPLILLYTGWVYRVLSGPITVEQIRRDGKRPYWHAFWRRSNSVMWYFTWILGLGLALGFGVVNAMWLEASYAFGDLNEDTTCDRFVSRSRSTSATPDGAP